MIPSSAGNATETSSSSRLCSSSKGQARMPAAGTHLRWTSTGATWHAHAPEQHCGMHMRWSSTDSIWHALAQGQHRGRRYCWRAFRPGMSGGSTSFCSPPPRPAPLPSHFSATSTPPSTPVTCTSGSRLHDTDRDCPCMRIRSACPACPATALPRQGCTLTPCSRHSSEHYSSPAFLPPHQRCSGIESASSQSVDRRV